MTQEDKKLQLIQMILTLQDEELLARIQTLLSKQAIITSKAHRPLRRFGFAKGLITYVAPDFDETPPGL